MKINKYVRFEDNTVVVFSNDILHIEAAKGIPKKPISAGYFMISNGDLVANGASTTLNLESHEGDSKVIQDFLNV